MRNRYAGTLRNGGWQQVAYTLGDAARATGISKSALSRAIGKGTISANRNDDGSFSIEPVELHRVYPPLREQVRNPLPETPHNPGATPDSNTAHATALAEQVVDLQRRLDAADAERREAQARVMGLLSGPIAAYAATEAREMALEGEVLRLAAELARERERNTARNRPWWRRRS